MRWLMCVGLVVILVSSYAIATDELKEDKGTERLSSFMDGNVKRFKRQQQQQDDLAGQFFDRVFGIPINTLNSVNDLVKSTIPMFRRARDRIQQQYQTWQQPGNGNGNDRPQRNSLRPRPSLRSEE